MGLEAGELLHEGIHGNCLALNLDLFGKSSSSFSSYLADERYFIINYVNFSARRRVSRRETAATWNTFKSNIHTKHASTRSCRSATKHSDFTTLRLRTSSSSYIYACPRTNYLFVCVSRSLTRAISWVRDRKKVFPLSFIFLSLSVGVNWTIATSSRKSAGRMAKRKISALLLITA